MTTRRITNLSDPAEDCDINVASDTALARTARGFVVLGVAGDVKVTTRLGNVRVIPAVPVGLVIPLLCTKIWATGTTATQIVALY